MGDAAPLKLLAQDAEDLAVISAALQDAVVKLGDISYEPSARQLTISLNRYRWEAGRRERIRSAFQLAGVQKVESRNLRRGPSDAVVNVLAVSFAPGEAPGGAITLQFAGDGDLRAEVECVEAVLADVSQPWPTPRTPLHKD